MQSGRNKYLWKEWPVEAQLSTWTLNSGCLSLESGCHLPLTVRPESIHCASVSPSETWVMTVPPLQGHCENEITISVKHPKQCLLRVLTKSPSQLSYKPPNRLNILKIEARESKPHLVSSIPCPKRNQHGEETQMIELEKNIQVTQ